MSPSQRGSRRGDELELAVLRARRLRAQRKKRGKRGRRIGILVAALGVLIALALLGVGMGGAIAYHQGCSLASLEPFSIGQNTFVYAADGSGLGSIPSEPKATGAIEDNSYWQHGGIDPIGIARACWADISQGKVVQGGSTITQQL